MHQNAYQLYEPKQMQSCVVFASPHSGRSYSTEFRETSVLDELSLRSSEDAFVDNLFADAVKNGSPLLAAVAPRAFLDLNRAAEELDPAIVKGAPPSRQNPRIAAGLGVIPRVVSNGRAIYYGKLPLAEAQTRVNTIWRPYHRKLQDLLNRARMHFGQTVLIDCHSMPHEAVRTSLGSNGRPPEIVLGDRFGASASSQIVECVEAAFSNQGFNVARNAPFAGAFTTQHYGRPSRQQHVIQVEVDRSLYMDETRIAPNRDYHSVRKRISRAIQEITNAQGSAHRMAAE